VANTVSQLTSQVASLSSQLAQTIAQVAQLSSQIQSAPAPNSSNTNASSLTQLSSQISQLSSQISTLQSNGSQLTNLVNTINTDLSSVESKQAADESALQNITNQINSNSSTIQSLSAQVSNIQNLVQQLSQTSQATAADVCCYFWTSAITLNSSTPQALNVPSQIENVNMQVSGSIITLNPNSRYVIITSLSCITPANSGINWWIQDADTSYVYSTYGQCRELTNYGPISASPMLCYIRTGTHPQNIQLWAEGFNQAGDSLIGSLANWPWTITQGWIFVQKMGPA
jgi:outer membrane murein-binding lipoprotein Lpp